MKTIKVMFALVLTALYVPVVMGAVVEREASAVHSAQASTQGLGLSVCGWVSVEAWGPAGTVGVARCGTRSAACVTDETQTCSNRVYNGGSGMGNAKMPRCWIGTTRVGAGFAHCEWDPDSPPPTG